MNQIVTALKAVKEKDYSIFQMEDSYGCVVARKRGRERERERERGRRSKGVKSMVNSLRLSLLVDRGERKTQAALDELGN